MTTRHCHGRLDNRELKQQRRQRLRKRQLKNEFALYRAYSISFNLSYVGKLFWSGILKDCVKVQERKQKVVLSLRPRQNLKLSILTL